MRGAPQPGFSRLMRRIRSRMFRDTAGRPGLPRRILQLQNIRNALRCQAMTVHDLRGAQYLANKKRVLRLMQEDNLLSLRRASMF
jgi:hypothetical protein